MKWDAIVVGSGPNGLSAAITLAQGGKSVLVLEASEVVGGGTRTAELTLPGFHHDICSAVHPLAAASPFFRSLPLEKFGLEWVQPTAAVAHPLSEGRCVLLRRGLEETARGLGPDEATYLRLLAPLVKKGESLFSEVLRPPLHFPSRPLALARFGALALFPARDYARLFFRGERAQALFAGIAAHCNAPLEQPATASVGLLLNLAAHAHGWPFPRGGASRIATSLAGFLRSIGGEIRTGVRVESFAQLPPSRVVLFDLTPRQVLAILGEKLSASAKRSLESYRYGNGVFKIDWALKAPIPWISPEAAQAGTVHLGGTLEEIEASERSAGDGRIAENPFVLLSQPTLFDTSRAPPGKHIAWAYCHVPHGSTADMSNAIEAQVERFAPGFRELILARATLNTKQLEEKNRNYVGGDINGGALSLSQLLFRPRFQLDPYQLPIEGLYLCSASTAPGPGVHGMSGYHAAKSALRNDLA
ncbi:MAG: phytoene desaturase family protein [Bdellovibrionota bacterium]